MHSAPSVDNSGFVPVPAESAPAATILLRNNKSSEVKQQEQGDDNSPASYNSPTQKLAFGMKKGTGVTNSSQATTPAAGQAISTKLEKIFADEDEEVESKPKKKLVPIEYSDEEGEQEDHPDSGRKRSRRSSGRSSSRRHHGSSSSEVGMVMRGSSSLSSGDVFMLEEVKDRKLTSEERKKMTQTLVNNIPTSKEEVFRYQLKWDQIDKVRGGGG